MRYTLPLILALLFHLPSLGQAGTDPAETAYLRGYDLEQGAGEPAKALALYEQAWAAARTNHPALAARAKFRIGVCQKQMGRWAAARETWIDLLNDSDLEPDLAAQARKEIHELLSRIERVSVHGRVLDPAGRPAAGAQVFVGEWSFEPPVETDSNGVFAAERKALDSESYGFRYCPVYAEDGTRRLAGVAVGRVVSNQFAEVPVRLETVSALAGTVVDTAGRPVADAEIEWRAFLPGETPIYVPYERLIPPVRSGADGSFRVASIAAGLRIRVSARKEEYALRSPREVGTGEAAVAVPAIVLELPGRTAISGRIADEKGVPLAARVTARTMPPESRELATVRTGEDGRYRLTGLIEGRVAIRAEALAAGYAWRGITGIPTGTDGADFALARQTPIEKQARVGEPAPEVAAENLNSTPLSLAASAEEAVLIAFWNRATAAEPPEILGRWQRAFGARGLRIWCLHDHTGYPEELMALIARRGLGYAVAIDRYAPAPDFARNSLTAARYGLGDGQVALIDRAGRLVMTGSPGEQNDRVRLETEFTRLVRPGGGTGMNSPAGRDLALREGAPPPPLNVSRWLRGESPDGGPANPADWRGRVVILHFASAYLETQLRRRLPGEMLLSERIFRLFEPRGAELLWILPDAENGPDAERLALQTAGEYPVAVDREGRTYRAYGVGTEPQNCVLDRRGRVAVRACSDSQLFRVVKDLTEKE